MADRLAVLVYGEVVGHLDRDDVGEKPRFRYEPGYVDAGTVPLSLRLPISATEYPAPKVEPYLRGLLPENEQTRERWATRFDISPDDYFGMLAEMGGDCPGAVQFCRPDEIGDLAGRSVDYQKVSDGQIAQRLRDLVEQPASWTMPGEHWSLAGQQEKFALTLRKGSWYEAHGFGATTHIFKPGIRVLLHQALVEHVTMRAAADLGVAVADSELLSFEDQWVIVVARFDRYAAADGTVVRTHQEDFCQALGRQPENKYESRGGPTLADMVGLVRRQLTEPADDLLALADFVAVNVVAGAPDGHSKNLSLLLPSSGERWVAPLYDLATGLGYASDAVERRVAVSVGGERIFSRVRRKQWAKAATALGIDVDLLLGRVAMLAEGYPTSFERALDELGDVPGVEEVADRTLPDLAAHCQRLLDQLDQ